MQYAAFCLPKDGLSHAKRPSFTMPLTINDLQMLARHRGKTRQRVCHKAVSKTGKDAQTRFIRKPFG